MLESGVMLVCDFVVRRRAISILYKPYKVFFKCIQDFGNGPDTPTTSVR
jgi:hypothetical protein